MSLFTTPEEHAANSPETWVVEKAMDRLWHLKTAGGGVLDSFSTKKAAVEARVSGAAARSYHWHTRWYAGETPPGYRSYAEVAAGHATNRAYQAGWAAFRAGEPRACPGLPFADEAWYRGWDKGASKAAEALLESV